MHLAVFVHNRKTKDRPARAIVVSEVMTCRLRRHLGRLVEDLPILFVPLRSLTFRNAPFS